MTGTSADATDTSGHVRRVRQIARGWTPRTPRTPYRGASVSVRESRPPHRLATFCERDAAGGAAGKGKFSSAYQAAPGSTVGAGHNGRRRQGPLPLRCLCSAHQRGRGEI